MNNNKMHGRLVWFARSLRSRALLASTVITGSTACAYMLQSDSRFASGKDWSSRFNLARIDSRFTVAHADEIKSAPAPRDIPIMSTSFVADAIEIAHPSVVHVSIYIHNALKPLVIGSGFILTKDGHVITNAHVAGVTELKATWLLKFISGELEMQVELSDGTSHAAKLVAYDDTTDIALLKIDTNNGSINLTPALLGSSRDLRVGEFVVAMGSPHDLRKTATFGIVSAINREAGELGMQNRQVDYIQIDAAITQGNSGGPCINMKGEVIGISNLEAKETALGFIIPVDLVLSVAKQLLLKGFVSRPYVGLSLVNLTNRIIDYERRQGNADFPADISQGILTTKVLKGSPAARAGLLPGDVIVAVDGTPVSSSLAFFKCLGYHDFVPGRTVTLDVRRGLKQKLTLHLKADIQEREKHS